MKITIHAQTERAGNFQAIFVDFENATKFLYEVFKQLQKCDLQKTLLGSNDLFANCTHYYSNIYKMIANLEYYTGEEDCKLRDYSGKNIFDVRLE